MSARRHLWAITLAAACSVTDGKDRDTDVPGDGTDAPSDDTDVSSADDSDDVDDSDDGSTDDTGSPAETDDSALPPIDTAETDVDTDPQLADIQLLRAGVYPLQGLLRFEGLVVTGRRFRTTPQTSNAISVQDPQYDVDAAMLVDLKDLADASIPDIGDVVTLVGRYRMDPTGGGRTSGQSVLEVNPTDPLALIQVTGTSALPAPVDLTTADFGVTATIEPYEMMRVRVAPAGHLSVTSNVNGVVEFRVTSAAGGSMLVEDFFWDVRDAHPTVAIAASFASLSGVVHFEAVSYELAPTGPGDATGYAPPP